MRLTERSRRSDLDADGGRASARQLPTLAAERALGVDGTTAELAALAGSRTVRSRRSTRRSPGSPYRTDEERRARLIEPDRSDVLAAGVVIVRETLRHLGLPRRRLRPRPPERRRPGRGRLPEPEEGAAPPGAYTCC